MLFSLLVLATIGAQSYAAPVIPSSKLSVPSKCTAFRPGVLHKSLVLKESEANKFMASGSYGQTGTPTNNYWMVYSDRADNPAYVSSTSNEKCATLEFNEELRIAKISNGRALVYVEPQANISYPLISENVEWKGWVPMSKLLLWESCLANDRGIYNKALLCHNLNEIAKGVKDNIGHGYLNPDKTGDALQLITDMQFYFIMKRENGMVLLSTQNRLDGADSKKVLACWVSAESYVPWNQRSCLEPTWDHKDVEYFAEKNIIARVYGDETMTGDYAKIPFNKKTSTKYDQYLYRMNPYDLRFPILDDCKNKDKLYSMSTFSSTGGQVEGTASNNVSKASEKEQRLGDVLKEKQTINLAIVIDGTHSMKNYYPAVKEAIKEGCKYFDNKKYKIKVGVVIYRDKNDGADAEVEVLPLQPLANLQIINRTLDTGGKYGIRSVKTGDIDKEESLYTGINAALDKIGFVKGQSNIMLVVGDCGHSKTKDNVITQEALIAKIVDKDVDVMGFQVQNKGENAYTSFNTELGDIMKESLRQRYANLAEGKTVPIQAKQVRVPNSITPVGYNYKGSNVDVELYFASHRNAVSTINDGKMDPDVLRDNIVESISLFAQTVQLQLDVIVSKSIAVKKTTGFAASKGNSGATIHISDKFVENLVGKDYKFEEHDVLNFRGFAKKQDDSGREFFKPIIFISKEELQKLIKDLAPVAQAAQTSQVSDREPYIKALKSLAQSLVQGLSDAEVAKMSNDQIMDMVAGLNESANALKGYSLNDLSDLNVVGASEYLGIINDFKNKYDKLKSIHESNTYKYVRKFNGATYYWIPIEVLP